jgi:pantoate--beta-alanine ligase
MRVVRSIAEMKALVSQVSRPLGFVPTMGALHEGHLSLTRRARSENPTVAASIFVNPAQFGAAEDLASYPRDLERDLGLFVETEGVDIVLAPSTEDVYPPDYGTWIDVGRVGKVLEGKFRPGHFRGVATVVLKLFHMVKPDRAYFGQKDGQQSVVIKKLARDLDMDVDIVVCPTVREPDGLALSSRNVYLTPQQREAAPIIYKALCRAKELWEDGVTSAHTLSHEVRRTLRSEPLVERIDYVSVADAQTLEELKVVDRKAMVSTAAKIGKPRLIDNIIIG